MESLIISGGNRLVGSVSLKAAKNAVLPIIASAILSKEKIVLKNCPRITDITNMLNIINSIGGKAGFVGDNLILNCRDANPSNVEENLTKSIRSSVFVLGSIIGRFKKASICYPGGCAIGKRPIDLHIAGLKALNVEIIEEDGRIKCDGQKIRGGEVNLSFPSVGATENIMMAAVLTEGTTVINNAALEPEIVDLANFINAIGGKVSGAGSQRIFIEGVNELRGCEYQPISDRIVGGTILTACAACGGNVTINNTEPWTNQSVIDTIRKSGCKIHCGNDYISIESSGSLIAPPRISTSPFPGFPTDMQAQVMAMLTKAEGTSIIEENLFENRFMHMSELKKMGADLTQSGREVTIKGVKKLTGSSLAAMDLRGGAALIVAALSAEGISRISGVSHIDRGYEKIENMFTSLGCKIRREVAFDVPL